MSFGKHSSNSTGTQQATSRETLDPQIMALLQGNYSRAAGIANTPYQPYTGQLVAGFNSDQTAAQDAARAFANGSVGAGLLNSAAGAAQGAANYQPMTVTGAGYNPAFADPASGIAAQSAPYQAAQTVNAQAAQNGPYQGAQTNTAGAFTSAFNKSEPYTNAPVSQMTGATVGPYSAYNATQGQAAQSGRYQGAETNTAGLFQAGPTTNAQAASIDRNAIRDTSTQGVSQDQINSYMNPYENSVVSTTLADLERQRQIENVQNAGAATRAKAFNGTGAAIMQGLTNDNYTRAAANAAASLRSQGFNTALQNSQTDLARQLQSQLANQGADISVAGTNAGYGQQASLANAGAANARDLANAQMGNTQAQFNAGALNQGAQFNAANQLQNQQFNAANQQQMNLANTGYLNAAGQQNAQNSLTAALANAGYGQQASANNQAALNQGAQFNAANTLQNQQFNAAAENANNQLNAGLLNNNSQFNAAAANQTGQFNAANALQNGQFNAGLLNTTNLTNAGAANANNQFNAGNQLNANLTNAQLQQQAMLANQAAQNQANLTNAGAANQAGQFGATQSLNAALANQAAGLTGAGLNLQGAGALAGLSDQQRAQAIQSAALQGGVGDAQQANAQAILDAAYAQYGAAQNWPIQLQQLLNQSAGLFGNPTLTNSQSTGTTNSRASGWNIGLTGGGGSASQAAQLFGG